MSKKTDGWMPLYVADYLADTSRLTTEQHGAYLLLIMDYWRNGPPPDDESVLASITKLPIAQWRRHAAMLRAFFVSTDGKLVQKRIDAERQKASSISDKRTDAAKQGAAKRWGKEMPNGMPNGIANEMPEAMQTSSQNDAPSPIPTSSLRSEVNEPNGSVASKLPTCPVQQVIDQYHEALPELPMVRLLSDQRRKAVGSFWKWVLTSTKTDGTPRARTADQALTWIRAYFDRARDNDFLMGRTERAGGHANWRCDFDFLLTEKGKKHVIEKTEVAA